MRFLAQEQLLFIFFTDICLVCIVYLNLYFNNLLLMKISIGYCIYSIIIPIKINKRFRKQMKVYSRKNSLEQSIISKNQSQFKTPIKKNINQVEAQLSTNIKRTYSQTDQKSIQNYTTPYKLTSHQQKFRQIHSDRCQRSPLTKSCFTKLRKIRSIKQIQEYNNRQSVQRYNYKSPQKIGKPVQFPSNLPQLAKQQNYLKNGSNVEYMSANAIMKRKIKKNKKDKIATNIFALQESIMQKRETQSQKRFVVIAQ